jgi:hypothetical protein
LILAAFGIGVVVSPRMELTFATPDLEAIANSSLKLDRQFGADAGLIRQRLFELAALENLAAVAEVPTLGFSRYGRSRGQFSIAVGDAGRIRFKEAVDSKLKGATASRRSELDRITAVQILSIG